MLSRLEALETVAALGTVSAAASRLRLTQGAVSKRLQALERDVGEPLLVRSGRGVVLTPRGAELLDEVRPLLSGLRRAVSGETGHDSNPHERFSLAMSESLLASWGAALVHDLSEDRAGSHWTLHAHRSPLVIDRVRSGEVAFGICAGRADVAADLTAVPLAEEELVIVPAGLGRTHLRGLRRLEVIGIEEGSATWKTLRHRLGSVGRLDLTFTHRIQSFAAIVALARHGFGHGLVPRPLAAACGIPNRHLLSLPRGGLTRPIQLVARPRTLALPHGAWFRDTATTWCRHHPDLRPA